MYVLLWLKAIRASSIVNKLKIMIVLIYTDRYCAMPSMIAIVHSIYSQSVHAPASHAGLMDNEAERYCTS